MGERHGGYVPVIDDDGGLDVEGYRNAFLELFSSQDQGGEADPATNEDEETNLA